jgi:hypothetical protein
MIASAIFGYGKAKLNGVKIQEVFIKERPLTAIYFKLLQPILTGY